jgi:hypothetical protein
MLPSALRSNTTSPLAANNEAADDAERAPRCLSAELKFKLGWGCRAVISFKTINDAL